MFKKSIKTPLFLSLFTLLTLTIAYIFTKFNFPADDTWGEIFSNLLLEIISGFVLGVIVYLVSMLLEDKRQKDQEAKRYKEKYKVLKNLIKPIFTRPKSALNFKNSTPTFYFDVDWINPLYDLLIKQDRKWEAFIHEYKKLGDENDELINLLSSFINKMESALIQAEKLDRDLWSKEIQPKLAARMDSVYIGDRNEAQIDERFNYKVIRATWTGAKLTEITFSIAPHTDMQLNTNKIKKISNGANELKENKSFKETLKELITQRDEIKRISSKIKQLVEENEKN